MKQLFLGLLVVIGVALGSVWPVVVKPDRVADYGKDGMLLAAIQMNWHQKISDYIRHKTDPNIKIFDGYFFYAEKNSLAYSDMLFITSWLTYWPVRMSNSPAAGAGLALVWGQVFTMVITFVVFARWSRSVWSAVVGSVVFGLSQIHFMYQVHLHTWIMGYWLLGFWLFIRRKYLLSGLFLGMQMWEAPLGVYFGLGMITIYIILNLKFKIFNQFEIFNISIFIVIFGATTYLPAKAYWEVSDYYQYVRTIRDAAHHGLSLNNLDGFVSPGIFMLFGLSVWKLSSKFKVLSSKQKFNIKYLILIIVFSYILALGPVLKWSDRTVKLGGIIPVPLPYAAAYYTIPGWQAFRVPSRWMVVTGWAMAGVIAMSIANLKFEIRNLNSNSKFKISNNIGIAACLVVAVWGGTRLTKYVDLPREIPPEYLTNQEILTFKPMGGEAEEIERMYFSILAGKKTMNGFSGFLPPGRVKYLIDEE